MRELRRSSACPHARAHSESAVRPELGMSGSLLARYAPESQAPGGEGVGGQAPH